jgi:serine/threonine-protein kinase
MFCSRCGTEFTGQPKFCPSCGLDLMATTPVEAIGATGERTDREIVSEALASEYEVQDELGRGGMALVYQALERELGREVAVKVLPFALGFDAEFVERFQREARTAAQLEHPNIIPIYRVGRSGRVIYFVMKFLRGGSLAGLLQKRGRLTPPEIRRLLVDCGSALAYAHQRGIVHRDMKPDNVMFDEFGQVLLTDFGIAKAMSGGRLTGTGMSIGTPHYMSPEQARAQAIDGRSDIYSLGVVAYQCLTGQVPFDGEDSFAIGYKHITEPLPPLTLAGADDRQLYETIRRMMMKDPGDRPQDCAELIASLQRQPTAAPGSLISAAVAPAAPLIPTASGRPATSVTPTRAMNTPRTGTRRAPAVEPAARSSSWPLLVLLAAGAAGAGFWYVQQQDASATTMQGAGRVDTVVVQAPAPPAPIAAATDSVPAADSTRATAPAPVPDSGATPAAAVPSPVPVAPADSGAIKIVGIPAGSSVLIDGGQVTEAVTRLPAGRHTVGVLAPLHNFYEETVQVVAGDLYELEPVLVRQGVGTSRRGLVQRRLAARGVVPAGCDKPGPTYNADHSCYDVRPRPLDAANVTLTPDIKGTPSPSTLLVKVSVDGHPLEVRGLRPSNDLKFEILARQFAANTSWVPAMRDGAAVEGWTSWAFTPVRQ